MSFTGSAALAIYFSLKDPILARNIHPSIQVIESEGASLKVESKSGLCGLRWRCKMGSKRQAAAFMNVLARLSVSGPEVCQRTTMCKNLFVSQYVRYLHMASSETAESSPHLS